MNVYVFWILFFGLWGIVPLMIIKGRTDETSKIKTVPEVKAKKKAAEDKHVREGERRPTG